MVSIKSNSNFLTVTTRDKTLTYNFDSGEVHHLEFNSKINTNVSNSKYCEKLAHAYESLFLPCCDISSCGNWFVSCIDKSLLLWKTLDWSLKDNCTLQRSPTKIIISHDGTKVVVADKGGDVCVFERDDLTKQPSYLLGHLSLVTDVLITLDEKYVITCDRDEKIRISCYPNAHNINSYCLGHEEFISCIKLLPHSQNILISSSGDETLRFWDYKDGRELLTYSCSSDFDKANTMLNTDEHVEHIAVIKFETFSINNNESCVCVLLDCFKGCLTYSVVGIGVNLKCQKLQIFHNETVIDDVCAFNNVFLISSNNKCKVFALHWNEVNKKLEYGGNEKVNNAIISVNKYICDFDVNCRGSFSVLYKRHYDNVQEYYKRKSAIMSNESSKKNKVQEC